MAAPVSAGTLPLHEMLSRRARELGYSARQVSSLSGVSPSYVSKFFSGTLTPSFTVFACMAVALDLNDAEIAFCVRQQSMRGRS